MTTAPERLTARVSIFKNRQNQAIRIPKAMSYPDGVTELVATRTGDVITLQPARKTWASFAEVAAALVAPDDPYFDYLAERHDVVGFTRVVFDDEDEAGE